jgi:hypothetical protein
MTQLKFIHGGFIVEVLWLRLLKELRRMHNLERSFFVLLSSDGRSKFRWKCVVEIVSVVESSEKFPSGNQY